MESIHKHQLTLQLDPETMTTNLITVEEESVYDFV